LADQGNLIKADADKAMVVINQIQPIYVAFSVPERHLAEIKQHLAKGTVQVAARLPQGEGPAEEGVLTFVNNTVDPATGTILLKGTFDNREKRLWPGLFADVTLGFGEDKNALVAPAPAVQAGQEGAYVFVVKPDLTVEMRPVEVGRTYDGEVVLKKGVAAGETVVTSGHLRLTPGAKVEIKTPAVSTDKPS
jgi:multidrug efflux system membrane fusion protein